MEIKNTVSSDFDRHLSIVKSVYDCRLSSVILGHWSPGLMDG